MEEKKRDEPPKDQEDRMDDLAENLAYDENKESYELDVDDTNADYDHPLDYDTVSQGAEEDDSTFDNSNPYVGDEYTDKEELLEEDLDDLGMRIDEGEIVELNETDERLAETPEDERTDLDAEGYPKKE